MVKLPDGSTGYSVVANKFIYEAGQNISPEELIKKRVRDYGRLKDREIEIIEYHYINDGMIEALVKAK